MEARLREETLRVRVSDLVEEAGPDEMVGVLAEEAPADRQPLGKRVLGHARMPADLSHDLQRASLQDDGQ